MSLYTIAEKLIGEPSAAKFGIVLASLGAVSFPRVGGGLRYVSVALLFLGMMAIFYGLVSSGLRAEKRQTEEHT